MASAKVAEGNRGGLSQRVKIERSFCSSLSTAKESNDLIFVSTLVKREIQTNTFLNIKIEFPGAALSLSKVILLAFPEDGEGFTCTFPRIKPSGKTLSTHPQTSTH